MTVTPFNGVWWCLILVIIGAAVLLGVLRRNSPDNRQFMVRFGAVGIFCLVLYKIALALSPTFAFFFWEELPLHPCHLVVLLSIPAVLAGDGQLGRALKGFCFFGGIIFTPVALAMPLEGFYDMPLLSAEIIGDYGFHGMILVLGVSFYTLGLYRPKQRDIPLITALTGGFCVVAHGINLLLRATVHPQANFFFTYGIEGNPLTDLFRTWIPADFFCILPFLPAMALMCAVITAVVKAFSKIMSPLLARPQNATRGQK